MTDFIPDPNASRWWGPHDIGVGRSLNLQMGPLQFNLHNHPHEWMFEWQRRKSMNDALNETRLETARFIFSSSRDQVTLSPILPDRSMTTRFQTPLRLLPGDRVRIYVVVPLWVAIRTSANESSLMELATWRLSDTWIGPMSAAGEVGYAGRVPAYVDVAQVPRRTDLAVAPVWIHNRTGVPFQIDRFNLPARRLNLYFSEQAGFWTETMTIEHGSDSELADAQFDRQPPREAAVNGAVAQLMTGPRDRDVEGVSMVRAFSSLFQREADR